jgi:hypothetical protein
VIKNFRLIRATHHDAEWLQEVLRKKAPNGGVAFTRRDGLAPELRNL